ncbi:portal protein [Arenimonas sp.]|uniref:portal protein n=1 Tax=Arenimonas sp. TaxID=1872635 RepID=UPI0039E27FD9
MTEAAAACKRLESLKAARQPHEETWRQCFLYVDPIRSDGFNSTGKTSDEVRSDRANVTDSTADDSARMLAAAIMSGLTPANSRWFGLDVGDETDEERRWLDRGAEIVWKNIHNANYDAEAYEASLDLVGGGWFVLFIDDDREHGGYVFTQFPIGTCYLASSRPDGRADTLYRTYQLTADACASTFGLDNLSEQTRKLAQEKPDTMVDLLHVVEPRKLHVPGARLAKNMPFASYTFEVNAKKLLRESGYHECPFIAPRWKRISPSSAYGIGPIANALADIKTLNLLVRNELIATDLAVAGMWIAEDDGVLNARTIKVGPRKVIVANSVESMKPLLTGSDFQVSFTVKADLQRAIRKVMMSDQLEPKDGPAMTATEVHVRVNLIRQLLGPVYGRLQPEWLRPLVERCFGLAFRAGILGPMPESLRDREYMVSYDSPMARAQKLEDVSAMDRFEASLGIQMQQIGQVDPEAAIELMDNYNADAAQRKKAELLGVPAELIVDAKDVAKRRAARAEQKQQQQQQAMLAQGMSKAAEAAGTRIAQRAL